MQRNVSFQHERIVQAEENAANRTEDGNEL